MIFGLILDNIVVFLYRIIARHVRERQTRQWPTVIGVIDFKEAQRGSYPQAVLAYAYTVDGERYFGRYRKPFWHFDSTYDFIRSVAQPCDVVVRYRVDHPSVSFVREQDQRPVSE